MLAIVALTAFLAGGIVQSAGGNGGVAAVVSAMIAAVLAVPLLSRRRT